MPSTKEKSQKISTVIKENDNSDSSLPVINEALFAKLASDPFFTEKRERVIKILEQVDWSKPENSIRKK